MNKVILVVYLGVKNLKYDEIPDYSRRAMESLKSKETNDIVLYMIPDNSTNQTRMECLYPNFLLGENEYENVMSKLDKLNEKLNSMEL